MKKKIHDLFAAKINNLFLKQIKMSEESFKQALTIFLNYEVQIGTGDEVLKKELSDLTSQILKNSAEDYNNLKLILAQFSYDDKMKSLNSIMIAAFEQLDVVYFYKESKKTDKEKYYEIKVIIEQWFKNILKRVQLYLHFNKVLLNEKVVSEEKTDIPG